MKILVAYDGSEFADAAIRDLRNAGLPDNAEALVYTVADVIVPPEVQPGDEVPPELPAIRRAHERAKQKLNQAEARAREASERIQRDFPNWDVSFEAAAESPAWAIIFKAGEWQANLIVVGSHGKSGLAGRLILGSVSQRVLYEAPCPVRIGRESKAQVPPLRILVGIDGSSHSKAAVQAIAKRRWPEGTQVRLLTVVDTVMLLGDQEEQEMKWLEVDDVDKWDDVRALFKPEAELLRASGLDAEVMIRRGHPTQQLLDEAETWGAHGIFVGAKGVRGIERLLLGSVSAALAARAHCSVEVVRPLD
ncbi:MAG TPA: universal stress protein [Pyrinomonadaceae bacterium]|nr:universal stress protein [Pyrinomonadaceae bacterium]